MAATPKLYRKLASAHQFGVAVGGWDSLYLAEDHLLLRSTSAFVESYRRFYFSDIEAITICKTMRGYLWNAVWGFALFFFTLTFIYRTGWVSGTGTVIFFAALLINIARGPTSAARLQTRVQQRALPLRRLRPALKIIRMLREKIGAAQATIPIVETTPAVSRAFPPPLPTPGAGTPSAPPPLPGETVAGRMSWVHLVSFGMLIVAGLMATWEARHHHPVLIYCVYAAVALNVGWAIAALVVQRRRRLVGRVLPVSWINLGVHLLGIPSVYMTFTFTFAFRAVRMAQGPVLPPRTQMMLSDLRDMPGFGSVLFYYGIFCLVLGVVGYVLLMIRARKSALPALG